jgi:hypothetical protein
MSGNAQSPGGRMITGSKRMVKSRLSFSAAAAFMLLVLAYPAAVSLCQDAEPIRVFFGQKYGVSLGDHAQLDMTVENTDALRKIDRFDLLIEYPSDAMTFDSASAGELFTDCDWEFFSCVSVDSSLIHLTAVANYGGNQHDPVCYFEGMTGVMAELSFTIAEDSLLECQFIPIHFYWQDCTDNYVDLKDDATYYVSNDVYSCDWLWWWTLIPRVDTLPNYSGVPDSCLDELPGSPVRLVDSFGGGVDVICGDSVDWRGDINLNGIPNEISDIVLFVNYFLYGLSVFETDPDAQIAATDVNNDGMVLTFRDLIYMYRIIIGDALPYPGPQRPVTQTAVFEQNTETNALNVYYGSDSLAGAYLVFSDSITPTCLLSPPVWTLAYYFDSNETRVLLIADIENQVISGPLLALEGSGILTEVQTTDFFDSEIPVTISFAAGEVDIDFVLGLIQHIFAGGPLPEPAELADANCDGTVDIDDVVWVIEYIFAGGPAPCDC